MRIPIAEDTKASAQALGRDLLRASKVLAVCGGLLLLGAVAKAIRYQMDYLRDVGGLVLAGGTIALVGYGAWLLGEGGRHLTNATFGKTAREIESALGSIRQFTSLQGRLVLLLFVLYGISALFRG